MSGNPTNTSHRRRRGRWLLACGVVLVVLVAVVVASIGLFVSLTPTTPPLALRAALGGGLAGPVDGTWDVGPGSAAGFRVRESALGFSNDVVGRTNGVTGSVVVSSDRIIAATFRIDLKSVKVGEKTQPGFATSLDTKDHPAATFTLTQPVSVSPALSPGAIVDEKATGQLAMHGVSRPVTFTVKGRGDGTALQVAGFAPIALSDWGIRGPASYGVLGSLADHGVAEFFLVLRRQ